ncbi:PAS domain-containing protein [Litoribacter ruber]|uniref:PAS domain-containing protein n=1 Tax=Litoribacter ruber TaxID=702568 RepID=UPI001BD98D63|nr:PAS domain-containing protein [Litoribacter ruber]MBT0810470.1 PAS domain-containing protein [Litoribacter ruber]
MKNPLSILGSLPESSTIEMDARIDLVNTFQTYQTTFKLNIACIIFDLEGKITYVNDRFCEISKFTPEELVGSSYKLIQSKYHSQSFYNKILQQLSLGKSWKGMVNSQAKDGSDYWKDTLIIPVVDKNQTIKEYLSLRLPIDQSAYFKKNSKLINEILFNISHKLRKPVTQISSVASYLESESISLEEFQDLVKYMKNAAVSIDTYTRELNEVLSQLK